MSIAIREARAADVPAIVALLADDPLGAAREGDPSDAAYARAFAAVMAHPGARFFVAQEDGALVGCLQLMLLPGLEMRGLVRAEIESVRTASHRRGRGIGAMLAAHAVEEARRAGAGLVQLASSAARADAHRFWEAQGFAKSHVAFKMMLEAPSPE